MMRSACSKLLPLLLCAASSVARADVEPPPPPPTMYIVLHAGSLAGKAATISAAVKAALPGVPKGFSVAVVGAESGTTGASASSRLKGNEANKIVAEVKRLCAGSINSELALTRAVTDWLGSSSSPRHHAIVVSGAALKAAEILSSTYAATRVGFTVSVLSLGKLDDKEAKQLESQGAGHAKSVAPKGLAAALRAELAWGKLTKTQEQAITDAASKARVGVLRILGARTSVDPNARSYTSKLRRTESLVGKKLAVSFRRVQCGPSCDVADTRRQLLTAARELLKCLEAEGALGKLTSDLSVELKADGKISGGGAAAGCAGRWFAKRPRGVSATLLVGAASAVQ